MVQKIFNLSESSNRTQTHVITIPGLKSISSVSTNTGTATVKKVEGDKITIEVGGGTYSRRVQTGGSYTPADSKEVKEIGYTSVNENIRSISYNKDGYRGTLRVAEIVPPYHNMDAASNPSKSFPYYYTGTVTRSASDTRTYTYYYQYNITVNYIDNSSPIISGRDSNLGDKNTSFIITYSVDDEDVEDKLTIKEKINGKVIRIINNAPRNEQFSIEITEEMLYSYDLYTTNTIEIEVSDGQGHVVYRRYTFKRTNTAPKISGQDEDLGEKTEGFKIAFSATDQESDTMSAKVYLNDKLIKTYEVIDPNKNYTYTLGKLEFVQLNNTDVHKIRIEVQDHNNATAIRNYTFTRKLDRIMYFFKKETDAMATQILISPTWHIATGAEAKVLVCNNAFDVNPKWEDATEQVLLERHFNFTNKEKKADEWGVGVQIIINKGAATGLSYLAGFGGAYK